MLTFFRRPAGFAAAMLTALLAFAPGEALAQAGTPQDFLNGIYKNYRGKDAPGTELSAPADIKRYFTPDLADAMIKDMEEADKNNEVGLLDGDPFVDAQDWEIKNLKVEVKPAGPDAATATVTFSNFDEKQTVRLDLVKTPAGWRIREIKAPSGSLRELFELK